VLAVGALLFGSAQTPKLARALGQASKEFRHGLGDDQASSEDSSSRALRMPFEGATSPLHLVIVAVVALLVLGPEELPKTTRRIARIVREITRVRES
jgi:Sec-independent protein translocase protein TatA